MGTGTVKKMSGQQVFIPKSPLQYEGNLGIVYTMMKKVDIFIKKYHMLNNGDRVIAGISGGADSVCLLFVLLELKRTLDIDIVAVHINHGIRGETAARDERFVEKLCRTHQVKCEVYHENVVLFAKNRKQSLEEAGRDVRRAAFAGAFEKYGGTKIALAHHQNDNAETLLMNLARGTGLKGLGGIQPVSGHMIRPLLVLDRKEIEECVKETGWGFCRDETNDQDGYTRNRLRHHIIPFLEEQVNTQAVRHMNEAMDQMQKLQDYMEGETKKAYDACVTELSGDGVRINKRGYDSLHDVLKGLLVHKCLSREAGAKRDITLSHVEAVKALFDRQCSKTCSLPYSITAIRDYDGVVLRKCQNMPATGFLAVTLKVPGITWVPGPNLTICCRILEKTEDFSVKHMTQKPYTKWFDYDIIKGKLLFRPRQSGDSIVIDKEGRRQKIKSYFINEKIPREIRDSTGLLSDSEQILWIVGYRTSSAFEVSGQTRRILEIKVTEEKMDGRED